MAWQVLECSVAQLSNSFPIETKLVAKVNWLKNSERNANKTKTNSEPTSSILRTDRHRLLPSRWLYVRIFCGESNVVVGFERWDPHFSPTLMVSNKIMRSSWTIWSTYEIHVLGSFDRNWISLLVWAAEIWMFVSDYWLDWRFKLSRKTHQWQLSPQNNHTATNSFPITPPFFIYLTFFFCGHCSTLAGYF